jgi:hypothetical protein
MEETFLRDILTSFNHHKFSSFSIATIATPFAFLIWLLQAPLSTYHGRLIGVDSECGVGLILRFADSAARCSANVVTASSSPIPPLRPRHTACSARTVNGRLSSIPRRTSEASATDI